MKWFWLALLTVGATEIPFTVTAPSTLQSLSCYDSIPGLPMHQLQELRIYRTTTHKDTTLVKIIPAIGGEGLTFNFTAPVDSGTMGVIFVKAKNPMGESCIGAQYVFAIPLK